MIINKEVEINITNRNRSYYKNIGYDIKNSTLKVKIIDLNPNSKVKIDAICDVCSKEKSIGYFDYLKSISSGGYYTCSSFCAKGKVESTNRVKYGTDYPLQSKNKMDELKKYFTDKFGFDNPSKNEEVKLKRERTMYLNFGVKTNIILPETHKKAVEMSMSDESVQKRKDTNIKNYGVDNPMKSNEIYQRFRDTNIKKYGVEYPAQDSTIFNKTQKSQFKVKEYNGIKYQGTYELDFLEFCDNNNILSKISKIKSIKYEFNNKEKYYHPDFFIEELNLIIEIKSYYYYNLYLEKNLCKQESCIRKGYNFIFIINKDYTNFLDKIKKSS